MFFYSTWKVYEFPTSGSSVAVDDTNKNLFYCDPTIKIRLHCYSRKVEPKVYAKTSFYIFLVINMTILCIYYIFITPLKPLRFQTVAVQFMVVTYHCVPMPKERLNNYMDATVRGRPFVSLLIFNHNKQFVITAITKSSRKCIKYTLR